MTPFVSTTIDSWGNKRSCVNAGMAHGSDSPVFCPFHVLNISQLKVLAQFTAYSMSVCYGQAGGGEHVFANIQARNNKSSFSKSAFNLHFTYGAQRVSPHQHRR